MTMTRFALRLLGKSERAMKSARLDLQEGDYDSAVNRSYYAMFDVARAALLQDGVTEDKLPRTHNGVIELFRQCAVVFGKVDRQLASELSQTESLRIRADYTEIETLPEVAINAVSKAELFVQTVRKVFVLEESSLNAEYDDSNPMNDDGVSEPPIDDRTLAAVKSDEKPVSLEEIRRQARENWRKLRQQQIEAAKSGGLKQGADLSADNDGHSLDNEFTE